MGELIIGHTTHESARVWVRGDSPLTHVCVSATACGREVAHAALEVGPARDYTGHVDLVGLQPETLYEIRARFSSSGRRKRGRAEERNGRVRTFPKPDAGTPFSFLLGCCNLSTVALTSVGALGAGALGMLATSGALERSAATWVWPRQAWLRWLLGGLARRCLQWVSKALFVLVWKATSYQQPAPIPPSPFAEIVELGASPPAFMIHAGDQIYYDFPFPRRTPDEAEYRRAYREAWFEDPSLREFLSVLPHYMILDDHEIVDAFGSRPDDIRRDGEYLGPARRAYADYVHARNPGTDDRLFYSFQHGRTPFFVLDARIERRPEEHRMIGCAQMKALKCWLRKHSEKLKFVVSSVPFIAEVEAGSTALPPGEADDKWAGEPFRRQRDEILAYIHEQRIGPLVFLAGDMHCAYHATLRLGAPAHRITIHELSGGPVSQLDFAGRSSFVEHPRGEIHGPGVCPPIPYESFMRSFYSGATNVMQVCVESGEAPRVTWRLMRTATPAKPSKPLAGKICF